jgi:hypothetical protein
MSRNRSLLQSIEAEGVKQEVIKILNNIVTTTNSSNTTTSSESSVDIDTAIGKAVVQLIHFKSNSGKFIRTDEEALAWNNSSFDLKRYWVDRLDYDDCYELALATLGLLSINPSEASVERSFSAQKLIHSNLRNIIRECNSINVH